MSTVLSFAEQLLQNAGVSSFELSKTVLDKADSLLHKCNEQTRKETEDISAQYHMKVPHKDVAQCIEALGDLLNDIEPEKRTELGGQALNRVCVPYVKLLASSTPQDSVSLANGINAVGTLLSTLVKDGNARLVKEVFCTFEQLMFRSQKVTEVCDHHDDSTDKEETNIHIVVSVIQIVLEAVTTSDVEEKECSLSSLFNAFLTLLQHCDTATCFLISSTPLPLLVTNQERAEKVWDLIEAVHMKKLTINCSSQDLIFTLLCCLHTVFIYYNPSSPFTRKVPTSSHTTLNNPLFDVRTKGTFWGIIQMGLVSPDALTRKKCMYLLHCVLNSVQSDNGSSSVASDENVFWWEKETVEDLQKVWNDLILILETMEEKQVSHKQILYVDILRA